MVNMLEIYWQEVLFDRYLSVRNVSLVVGGIFLLSFIIILLVQCFAVGNVRAVKFNSRMHLFLAKFEEINDRNIDYFHKTCTKLLPRRVRLALNLYLKNKNKQTEQEFVEVLSDNVRKSGAGCLITYLVIYSIGVFVCLICGALQEIFVAYPTFMYAEYMVSVLLMGAVFFIVLAYQIYYIYYRYDDVTEWIARALCGNVQCKSKVRVQNNTDILQRAVSRHSHREPQSKDRVEELNDRVVGLVDKGLSYDNWQLLYDALMQIQDTGYMRADDRIRVKKMLTDLADKYGY